MEKRIEAALRDLKASIKRMKELLEWRKLQKQEERGDVPPSFRLGDDTERDIKIEEGVFWETVFDIQDALGDRDDETAMKWRKQLVGLEEEMRELTANGLVLSHRESDLTTAGAVVLIA